MIYLGLKNQIQIWDTQGQERFYTIALACSRRAHGQYISSMDYSVDTVTLWSEEVVGIVVVYDMTDMQSFEHVDRWLDTVSDRNVAKVLVGNKSDLTSRNAVSTEVAQALATTHGMAFLEFSAKDSTNMEVEVIYRALLSQSKEYLESQRPLEVERPLEVKRPLEPTKTSSLGQAVLALFTKARNQPATTQGPCLTNNRHLTHGSVPSNTLESFDEKAIPPSHPHPMFSLLRKSFRGLLAPEAARCAGQGRS